MHPLIVQYYDVIGDKMIERIKQKAEPFLHRARYEPGSDAAGMLVDDRTSTITSIEDQSVQPFTTISKTVSAITGMNTHGFTEAKDLKVASYAAGGHFEVHTDVVSCQKYNELHFAFRFD